MQNKPLNICFVAHFAYRALSGTDVGHIGGVERQTSIMARWLARNGHKVSVIVWATGNGLEEDVDGIRVIPLCEESAGIVGLRFFYPRWSSLISALAAADADIYYHNCAEYVTGQVAMWARSHQKTFIYSVASDPECLARPPVLSTWRERILFQPGLATPGLFDRIKWYVAGFDLNNGAGLFPQ